MLQILEANNLIMDLVPQVIMQTAKTLRYNGVETSLGVEEFVEEMIEHRELDEDTIRDYLDRCIELYEDDMVSQDDMGNFYRTSLKKILNAEGLKFSSRNLKERISALYRIAESGSKEERFFYLEEIIEFEIPKKGIVSDKGLDGEYHYIEGTVGYIRLKRYRFKEKKIQC